jgi:hypothetical protein
MEGHLHLHGGKGGQYNLHGGACIDAMQLLANLIALPFSLFVRIGVLVSPSPHSWGSKDKEGDAIHTWQFLSFRIIVLHNKANLILFFLKKKKEFETKFWVNF